MRSHTRQTSKQTVSAILCRLACDYGWKVENLKWGESELEPVVYFDMKGSIDRYWIGITVRSLDDAEPEWLEACVRREFEMVKDDLQTGSRKRTVDAG